MSDDHSAEELEEMENQEADDMMIAAKERPILFNDEMVRAILDGRKTQTRRLITHREFRRSETPGYAFTFRDKALRWHDVRLVDLLNPPRSNFPIRNPFGSPGDRLWVREAFTLESCHETGFYEPPHHDGRPLRWEDPESECAGCWTQPHYRATDPEPELCVEGKDGPGCRWRPSIHMPRWASRLTLEVVCVWVERLREISEDDAEAEGFSRDDELPPKRWAEDEFRETWDSIYSAKGLGWAENPWVWVVEFERVKS